MTDVVAYGGPQCPRCEFALRADQIRTGEHTCPYCLGGFEATAFEAPKRVAARPELVVAGPEEASACANHARNAAVTSCQRCGLFICALCEMNLAGASYCPSCFERMRAEGSLQSAAKRYRNYAQMAYSSVIIGAFLIIGLGIPLGALGIYYAIKARRQRLAEGRSAIGLYLAMVLGALEVISQFVLFGWIVWEIANA